MDEVISAGNIRMRHEAGGRRLRVWYEPAGARVGSLEAEAFVREVDGSRHRPLQVLVDVAAAPDITAEYRETVGSYFRAHPGSMVVALVRLTPVIAVMVRMFALLTRIQLRSFEDQGEAVRWLEAESVAAPVP